METSGKCKSFLVLALIFHFYISWFVTEPSYFHLVQSSSRQEVGLSSHWNEIPFTREYEESRREAQRYVWEQWKDFKLFMHKLNLANSSTMKLMREEFLEVIARQQMLREADGYDKFRMKINKLVSKVIQDKLYESQNPPWTLALAFVTRCQSEFQL